MTHPISSPTLPTRRRGLLAWLEHLSLRLERLYRNPLLPQLNPFYQSGSLAALLLLFVGFSGVYITLFYQYGFTLSYNAVTRMNRLLMSHLMRAVHRWGGQALFVWGLIHAYRTFFMGRFRGPRWLAWLTGVLLMLLLIVAGITGYWMLWDARAQALTEHLLTWLQATPWGPRFAAYLVRAAQGGHESWLFSFLLLLVHILTFVLLALAFYLHIRRLQRPKWLPDLPWVFLVGGSLIVVAVFFPAEIGPQADFTRLPLTPVAVDPVYLPFLGLAPRGLLLLLLALTALGATLPWLPLAPQPPRLRILADRCTGCTLCARDCPYGAITMAPRHDGSHYKLIAVAHPERCVGCGICLGSCNDHGAIQIATLRYDTLQDALERTLAARADHPPVVFACERHVVAGSDGAAPDNAVLVPLPCVGALPPETVNQALAAGAGAVQVLGCPPGDCANREGNLWAAERMARERLPRLRPRHMETPILAHWVAPNGKPTVAWTPEQATAPFRLPPPEAWPQMLRAFWPPLATLVAVTLLLAGMMYLWRTPPRLPETAPRVEIVYQAPQPLSEAGFWALEIDGRVVQRAPATTTPLYLRTSLLPGQTVQVRFLWVGQRPEVTVALWQAQLRPQVGQIITVRPGLLFPHHAPASQEGQP